MVESDNVESDDVDEMSVGITENAETKVVDVVLKNRRRSIDIVILPSTSNVGKFKTFLCLSVRLSVCLSLCLSVLLSLIIYKQ
jgi:hypothetical protein